MNLHWRCTVTGHHTTGLILALICSIVLLGSCGRHAAYSKDLFDHRVDAAIIKWI